MALRVTPIVLLGKEVRLEPLGLGHAQGLYNRGRVEEDWTYLPRACFVDLADTRHWIDEALGAVGQLPFAIVETGQGQGDRQHALSEHQARTSFAGDWLDMAWTELATYSN